MGPHNTCFGTHALGSNPLNMHHTLIVGHATLPVDVVRNRNFLENVVQTKNYNDICLFLYDIFTLSMNAFVKNLQMIYCIRWLLLNVTQGWFVKPLYLDGQF